MFFDYLEEQFNTLVEDGSVEEVRNILVCDMEHLIEKVSRLIVDIFNTMRVGDLTLLHKTLNAKIQKGTQNSIFQDQTQTATMEDGSDQSEDEDEKNINQNMSSSETVTGTTTTTPEARHDGNSMQLEEDDGWQVVSRKGRKK